MAKNCDQRLTGQTQGSVGQARGSVPEQSCIWPTDFLIANLELELHVNPIRIRELNFPNRKYFAIFHAAFHSGVLLLHASTASSSSIQRSAPSLQNPWPPRRLIETPRLELLATPTKQSRIPNSNRDKKRVLRPQRRNWALCSGFCRHSRIGSACNSLCDSVPLWPSQPATSHATLTLRAPQSNLPPSCFVRASLGEHS
jgi:hypothetical protein